MSNPNYVSGRGFEYKVKQDYESLGWVVIRSAGSKGFYDLVALNKFGQTLLIQCKIVRRKGMIPALIKELEETKPFTAKAFNQVLAVKVKGEGSYEKIFLG